MLIQITVFSIGIQQIFYINFIYFCCIPSCVRVPWFKNLMPYLYPCPYYIAYESKGSSTHTKKGLTDLQVFWGFQLK